MRQCEDYITATIKHWPFSTWRKCKKAARWTEQVQVQGRVFNFQKCGAHMKELTVILKKDKAGVFSAHVLQEAREGPNLLGGKPHALFDAKQKAELKLRRDGFKGSVVFVDGYQPTIADVRDLPISTARDNYGIKGCGAFRDNTGVKP